MKKTDTKIDICVATFKRPELLKVLLVSLSGQRLDDSLSMRVLVIDNDPNEGARTTVESLQYQLSYSLIYQTESRRGISFTRNRALELADAEYVAFLDDDEFVGPEWLQQLYDAICRFGADVVFGPVVSILPDTAPTWAKSHPSFSRSNHPSGTPLQSGGTGNVLMRTAALGEPRNQFDEAFGLTGGEDIDFFFRLHLAGRKLVWCDSAVAYENVPDERLTTRWVYRRSFRGGQCFARVFVARRGLLDKSLWVAKKIFQASAGLCCLPFVCLFSHSYYVRLRCRVSAAIGQLTGLGGEVFQYREYQSPSYRADSKRSSIEFKK